jgi:ferredoxin
MRLVVDRDQCEANGVCVKVSPQLFKLDDNDHLHILRPEPGPDLLADAQEAVRRCPKQALKLVAE